MHIDSRKIALPNEQGSHHSVAVQDSGVGICGSADGDLASLLIAEFAEWFQNLGAKGVLPRAFTGVSKGGKQAVVILSGLPLDHDQRREFLIWLCRTEEFVAYAYGTQVGMPMNLRLSPSLDIYASSNKYDISKTLRIERQAGGTIVFFDQHNAVLPAKPDNGIFFGLRSSNVSISRDNDQFFFDLWRDLKSKSMWRSR